eukprot:GHVQ01020290.1.p1 GENE.GHVQ01020290.1~~GHVQ01020290.1.p1  ORF type:complete len:1473 (-),score=232.74 GHVQ01020290.1:2051-6469(-)
MGIPTQQTFGRGVIGGIRGNGGRNRPHCAAVGERGQEGSALSCPVVGEGNSESADVVNELKAKMEQMQREMALLLAAQNKGGKNDDEPRIVGGNEREAVIGSKAESEEVQRNDVEGHVDELESSNVTDNCESNVLRDDVIGAAEVAEIHQTQFDEQIESKKDSSQRGGGGLIPENFDFGEVEMNDEVTEPVEPQGIHSPSAGAEHNGILPFYLIDAHEDLNAGRIYLFGKVWSGALNIQPSSCSSCCVVVEEMYRCMFIKPKKSMNIPMLEDAADRAIDVMTKLQEGRSSCADDVSNEVCEILCDGDDVSYLLKGLKKKDSEEQGLRNEILSRLKSWRKKIIFNEIVEDVRKIKDHFDLKKVKIKPVERNYCFDKHGVSRTRNEIYGKFSFSARLPSLDTSSLFNSILKNSCVAHIFGTKTSLLELLLLKRRIRGPHWLQLTDYRIQPPSNFSSWCKHEVAIADHKQISAWPDKDEPPPPPLNVLCLGLLTVQNATLTHELCYTGMTYARNYNADDSSDAVMKNIKHLFGIRKVTPSWSWPPGFEDIAKHHPSIVLHPNEKSLLTSLCGKVQEFDVDVFVGHNIYAFELEVLANRFQNLRLPFWHKLSRLRNRSKGPASSWLRKGGGMVTGRDLTVGRLVCDTYIQARDLLRNKPNYKLATLAKELLCIQNPLPFIQSSQVPTLYADSRGLCFGISNLKQVLQQTFCIMKMLQMLPLTRELTNLAGNLWYSSLQNKRAERNDWLLLHEFFDAGFIVPDKPSYKQGGNLSMDSQSSAAADDNEEAGKKHVGYLGGLVLEPKVGLYDTYVLVLDFNSLYPSIIQEFNICFTTTEDRPDELGDKDFEVTDVSTTPGILPGILKRLVDKRRAVKQLLKSCDNDSQKPILKVREMALKLTANSLYGTIGYVHSRFHATPIAAYITRQGRNILQATKAKVEDELRMDVIYGDTDSIMINTGLRALSEDSASNKTEDGVGNFKKALKIAHEVKAAINKTHKMIEIDLDAVMKRLLLLKKKKYACIKVVDYENKRFERENKGLDIVRRDWCGLTKSVGNAVVDIMFSDKEVDAVTEGIHALLRNTAQQMENHTVPLSEFVITKALTKLPQQYADMKTQPHVKVAQRLADSGQAIRPGNEIGYVICDKQLIQNFYSNSLASSELTSARTTDDASNSATEASYDHYSARAFSPEEAVHMQLYADIAWYKAQQLHPPISRLCQHLGGETQEDRLAGSLGLEVSKYQHTTNSSDDRDTEELLTLVMSAVGINSEEAFKDVQFRTTIECARCQQNVELAELLQSQRCLRCAAWVPSGFSKAWTRTILWGLVRSLDRFDHICPECGVTTHRISADPLRCPQLNCQAKQSLVPLWTPKTVNLHLRYLEHFLQKPIESPSDPPEDNAAESAASGVNNPASKIRLSAPNIVKVLDNLEARCHEAEKKDILQCVSNTIEECSFGRIRLESVFGVLFEEAGHYPRVVHTVE